MHYTLIFLFVGIIIALQIYVFVKNLAKIRDYKNSMGNVDNFKIIEVKVPESFGNELNVETILEKYRSIQKSHEKGALDSEISQMTTQEIEDGNEQ